jgi:hypothetical protein
MNLRKAIPSLTLHLCVFGLLPAQTLFAGSRATPSSAATEEDHTQDFAEIVVPIDSLRIFPSLKLGITGTPSPGVHVKANFATGFCLDAVCRFIVTNYHVALTTPAGKIKKEKIIRRYLATGPQDEGATLNKLTNEAMAAFVMKRDLAIFELRRPLAGHHGLSFSLDELYVGQEVDIYGYPRGMIAPLRKLTRFRAKFKAPTTSGLLAFEYQSSGDQPMRVEGASGGIVVDRKTEKIIGIMSQSNETMAVAVPVETLMNFVRKVQPFIAEKIFPKIKDIEPSPLPGDLYPKFVPPHTNAFQHRVAEPDEVIALRRKAQLLADNMRNFTAVQGFAWGSEDKEPAAQADYQVRVMDGVQTFRRYPDGKDELNEVPRPLLSSWVSPAEEWSDLPNLVGTNLRLKIQKAADAVLNDRRMKVFQYYASVEDNLCPLSVTDSFGLFSLAKTVAVACYGEVWADEDANIIRISEHLDLSDKLKAYRGWDAFQVVLTYGWLDHVNEPRRNLPLTILTEGRNKNHISWCRGQFTNYQVFRSNARMIVNVPELTKTLMAMPDTRLNRRRKNGEPNDIKTKP